MKRLLFLLSLIELSSCASSSNKMKITPISKHELVQDIDFAQKKIKELHPHLYWYISKEQLDREFDSLKLTIDKPLTPIQFYFKLQPVITKIKEGHLSLRIPHKKVTHKQIAQLKQKKGLFSRFDYYVKDQKLYVIANKDSIENIKPGTEILAINNEPVSKYLQKYKNLISSDGENTTFHSYFLKDVFFNFYMAEKGLMDSAVIETKFENIQKTVLLRREAKSFNDMVKDKVQKKKTSEKKIKDYDYINNIYNRNFSFLDPEKKIGYLKVKSFSNTYSKDFYKDSFEKLKESQAGYLIIDIRNNYGGSLSEINNLYSYLALEPYILIKPSELANRSTPYKTNYFKKGPIISQPFKALFYPSYFLYQSFHTKKADNGVAYFKMREAKLQQPKENAFKGKVYVLINGSSFSASSILASKLKHDKRAYLVGEETGGANDGTVAGFYSYQTLPHSKIDLPIALVSIQPNINFSYTKKGVTPHQEIREDLYNIIHKDDLALDWIKCDIELSKIKP